MLCTVIDIRGDYAMVRYDDTGVESQVALFLLPFWDRCGRPPEIRGFRIHRPLTEKSLRYGNRRDLFILLPASWRG